MAVSPVPADMQGMMEAIATLTAQLMAIGTFKNVPMWQKTIQPPPMTVSTFSMTPD